jgi:inosine-uridine nucleoside N-ribohydrolase
VNALRILEAAGKEIPVYMGASRPAGSHAIVRAESMHGRDGLGNAGLARPKGKAEKTSALAFMIDLLKISRRKEVTIVATGPLTNIAQLARAEPSLFRNVAGIYVMGGLYNPKVRGNVSKHSEFNFFSDPFSADTVMGASARSFPQITAVGLEVTGLSSCAVDAKFLSMIRAAGSRTSDIAARILGWPVHTFSYFNLHDVFALFALMHPRIFATQKCMVNVAHSGNYRGRCTVKPGVGNVRICRQVDSGKFNRLVLDGLI